MGEIDRQKFYRKCMEESSTIFNEMSNCSIYNLVFKTNFEKNFTSYNGKLVTCKKFEATDRAFYTIDQYTNQICYSRTSDVGKNTKSITKENDICVNFTKDIKDRTEESDPYLDGL